MRTYGIQLAEGSTLKNATIDNGIAFPDLPSPGEMFFRSDLETLWFYTGLDWTQLGGAGTTSFITANPEPGSLDARQAVGTPNEIIITDNGAGSTINFALAPNLVLPGTGAITLNSGTTEQRPVTILPGLLRFNTTTSALESSVGQAWQSIVMDNDERLGRDSRVIEVRREPKSFQFGSISAACASLVGVATVEEQWLVDVGPGLYVEPEIVIPPFVHLSGFTEYAINISPAGTNHPVITMSDQSTLSFLNVWDATGPDQVAVRIHDTTNGVIVHKVCVQRASVGYDIQSLAAPTAAYLEYCDTTQNSGIGVNIISHAGFDCYVNLENFYVYGGDTNPAIGVSMDGPQVFVKAQSFGMEGADGTGVGLNMKDGTIMTTKAGSIFGWDTGAHMENAGAFSTANFIGVAFSDNTTWDVLSEHPAAIGLLSGTAARLKVNASASPGFTSAFSDIAANEYVQTGAFYLGKTQSIITNVSDLIIETPPMGLLTGGVITPIGGLNVGISAGTGYLRKDGNVTRLEWPAGTSTLAPGAAMYIFINKNGLITQSQSIPDILTNILLGRVSAGASSITGLGSLAVNIKSHSNQLENYLRSAVGPVYVTGSIVTENATTPRAVNVTAGQWFYGTALRNPSAKTAAPIVVGYRLAGATTTAQIATIPNGTIDNGTDLVPVTPGYFTKHALYSSSEGAFQMLFMAHAQTQHATLLDAQDAALPSPRIPSDGTPIIASVIMQDGVDSIIEIRDIRPMFMRAISGTTGSTSDHGELTGLGDDDHPQYVLTSGARAFDGDLNLATNDILNVGLINGLNIAAHGARHSPQGVDPIPTGTAVALTRTTLNTSGVANTLARSDHTHSITGFQPSNTELDALSLLNATGIMSHAEPNIWVARTLTGTAGRIDVANGTGATANPTFDLATAGTAGSYGSVTTDTFGRVVGGTSRSGTVAQVRTLSVNGGTTTALIPTDNTVPLSTEGATLATLAITPTSASSTIVGTITSWVDSSSNNRNVTLAVFRGTVCVSAAVTNIASSGRPQSCSLSFVDVPGVTTPLTYTVRVGAASGSTTYVNQGSGFNLGGSTDSAFILSEVLA